MAISLSKRKREETIGRPHRRAESKRTNAQDDDEAARALFRRAFEAKFQALDMPAVKSSPHVEQNEDEEDDDESIASDWSGLSDDEEPTEIVQIVDHARAGSAKEDRTELERIHRKAFMSSKPPPSEIPSRKQTRSEAPDDAEDTAEKANLKNDLALQRLLKESHLLNPNSANKASFTTEGRSRLTSLDMRLQDLGAKSSALRQEKMPMSQRKGIADKKAQRETSRRKEAAANGIILEKTRTTAKVQKRRERSIGGPTVGKFQRGALKLSSRDVRDIVGSGSRGGRKGRR